MKKLLIAKTKDQEISLVSDMACRHGLISGGMGSGNAVTAQVMAERLSEMGVPVFMADVTGDLSGLAGKAVNDQKFAQRVKELALANHAPRSYPVKFWDVYREKGWPITVSLMNLDSLLLGRLLNLTEDQTQVLSTSFKQGLAEQVSTYELNTLIILFTLVMDKTIEDGQFDEVISKKNLDAISHSLFKLKGRSERVMFGKWVDTFKAVDLLKKTKDGQGMLHVLGADRLIHNPIIYSTLMLWLLMELYDTMPETGGGGTPRIVLFIGEAHLLFHNAPESLIQKIENILRLCGSKGIGVYFISQRPLDIPEVILGLLGNKVLHNMSAYTPKDQQIAQDLAANFRQNPKVDMAQALPEVAIGEALVSFLDEKGIPMPVERANIVPPRSHLGAITDGERRAIVGVLPPSPEELDVVKTVQLVEDGVADGLPDVAAPAAVVSPPVKKGIWAQIKDVWNSEEAQKVGILYVLFKLFK